MSVQFELVTPERLLASRPVEMVVVPGSEGNFGVLPGHAPLIATIRPGTVDLYENRAVTQRIFVVGGIAEVTPERCTVLADEAVPVGEIDRAAAETEAKEAENQHAALKDQAARATGDDKSEALAQLRAAARRLAAAQAKLDALRTAAL